MKTSKRVKHKLFLMGNHNGWTEPPTLPHRKLNFIIENTRDLDVYCTLGWFYR